MKAKFLRHPSIARKALPKFSSSLQDHPENLLTVSIAHQSRSHLCDFLLGSSLPRPALSIAQLRPLCDCKHRDLDVRPECKSWLWYLVTALPLGELLEPPRDLSFIIYTSRGCALRVLVGASRIEDTGMHN